MTNVSFFDVSAVVLSLISLFLSLFAVYVSNKPYYIKLLVLEKGYINNTFSFAVANIGREVVYPKLIKIIDINTGAIYGQCDFCLEGQKVFAISPGEIESVKISLFDDFPYMKEIDVNPLIEVVIEDLKGKEKSYRNIFGVG